MLANDNNDMFSARHAGTPPTQSIKYAGSKLKLLPHILSLVDGLPIRSVFDGFSGTTRVSQAFARLGYRVTSCDIADWSYVLGVCYLMNRESKSHYDALFAHLNALPGYDGWFTAHYGGLDYDGSAVQKAGGKKPWQVHNTRKLDAIRDEIDRLNLSEVERCVALTALMIAMDSVDNTLGHFSSYLKQWSPRSYKTMRLQVPSVFENTRANRVVQGDIFAALNGLRDIDFCYFDPPYGSGNEKMPPSRVRYAAYYHIWTSIIRNDRPRLFGKAMRRADSSDTQSYSVFEEFRKDRDGRLIAIDAVDKLLAAAPVKYVALSYNPGGRAAKSQLHAMLNKHGRLLKAVEIDHKRNVMAGMKWTNEWAADCRRGNCELLFLLEKSH